MIIKKTLKYFKYIFAGCFAFLLYSISVDKEPSSLITNGDKYDNYFSRVNIKLNRAYGDDGSQYTGGTVESGCGTGYTGNNINGNQGDGCGDAGDGGGGADGDGCW